MNTLPQLGVKVHQENGEPLRQSGEKECKSQVRLVHMVVIPHQKLSTSQYFSSLDLCAGYWQIELEPESRPKSAFVTHHGLHEFVRLPFGLCNGSFTFQRLMEVVLNGLVRNS